MSLPAKGGQGFVARNPTKTQDLLVDIITGCPYSGHKNWPQKTQRKMDSRLRGNDSKRIMNIEQGIMNVK